MVFFCLSPLILAFKRRYPFNLPAFLCPGTSVPAFKVRPRAFEAIGIEFPGLRSRQVQPRGGVRAFPVVLSRWFPGGSRSFWYRSPFPFSLSGGFQVGIFNGYYKRNIYNEEFDPGSG
ncbi:MAG TPA: hypothetical protein GXX67_04365 [Petrimonas sp.]|nr:hypothetical protein [Petrimonas sp.]